MITAFLIHIIIGVLLTYTIGDSVRTRYAEMCASRGYTPLTPAWLNAACVLLLPLCLIAYVIKKAISLVSYLVAPFGK